jgi:hypothetical protein
VKTSSRFALRFFQLPAIWLLVILLCTQVAVTAQVHYSGNFENNLLDSSWQTVSGKWRIADVQDLRIAPAENGRQYVLCSDSAGIIRLFVELPDTVRSGQLKLRFSYYTYAAGAAAKVETEFHRKDLKDGIKGKPWMSALPVKGRWVVFEKLITIPSDSDILWVSFFNNATLRSKVKRVCFDALSVSVIK